LVTLLVKFRNKDCKTTELGLLLQVLPVRIVTFVETLRSHLKILQEQKNVEFMAERHEKIHIPLATRILRINSS